MLRNSLYALISTAALIGLAGSAMAQDALVELSDDVAVSSWNMTVDQVEDMDVIGPGGTKVGEVEEVLGADASTATALSVEFEDDANFGDRDDVIVPLDQFALNGAQLTLNASPEAVAQYPVWDD